MENENEVESEPDGMFESPDFVGCGIIQAVELPIRGRYSPVTGAVPVPVC